MEAPRSSTPGALAEQSMPVLELRQLTKSFPGVQALDDVSLQFTKGEIHGLVGENGAGKSTLMKLITGIHAPDRGEIRLDGQPVRFRSYRDSMAAGIHLVYQEIQVIPESTVAENVMLDKMITRGRTGIIDWPAVNQTARKFTDLVGLDLPPTTVVKPLSAAQKQLIQIAKALAADARVLLLDEPTSCLSQHEALELQRVLRALANKGVTLIYVSHRLEEVFALCDRLSVLRDGRHVSTARTRDVTRAELVQQMIGRAAREQRFGALPERSGRELLRAERLSRRAKVRQVSFSLHAGEILGFYGLVGAGRTETARLLIGDDQPDHGTIFVAGVPEQIRSVEESLRRFRIGYVSENRKEEGLLLESSVGTNLTITIWERFVHRLTRRISRQRECEIGQGLITGLSIKCRGLDEKTRNLSGGNQQKICLAKWLAADCQILIIDEPTVGVDIGAKDQIHRLIWDFAAKPGRAVILISSDMPEIIKLASRILVFRDKRVAGEIKDVDAPDLTYEAVSAAIGRYLA